MHDIVMSARRAADRRLSAAARGYRAHGYTGIGGFCDAVRDRSSRGDLITITELVNLVVADSFGRTSRSSNQARRCCS